MKKICFIGAGVMGMPIIEHLHQAGYELSVYTRTISKALPLKEKGIHVFDDLKEAIRDADIIFTMVGYPIDVETIYLSENGIINHAKKGAYLVDLTTSSPTLANTIYTKAKEKGLVVLDAPVSGGDIGAKNASLSIMVGGDPEAFKQLIPVFQAFGKTIVYQGKAGAGQHTKMANQIGVAGNIAAVVEAVTYALNAGLNPEVALSSITPGAAGSWQFENMAPKMLKDDFNPGFYIKHFVKDLKIAIEESQQMGLNLLMTKQVEAMFEALEVKGLGDLGTQALYLFYNQK